MTLESSNNSNKNNTVSSIDEIKQQESTSIGTKVPSLVPRYQSSSEDDKVQIKGWISEKVDVKFRKYVNEKHPKFVKGALSFELENAIIAYLEGPSTHTSGTKTANTPLEEISPVDKLHRRIIEYVQRNYGMTFDWDNFVEYHAPRKMVVEAIQKIKGVDKRTLTKWLKLLEHDRLIVPEPKYWATAVLIRAPGYMPTEEDSKAMTPEEQKVLDTYSKK